MLQKIIIMSLILPIMTILTVDELCPKLYRRFSSNHTFCLPPNQTCNIVKSGVTDEDKEYIVRLHNDFRNKVATGQETEAGGLPPAANMLEMIWDDELAAIAQKLTETCSYEHDCPNCRRVQSFSVGQNIGLVSNIANPLTRGDWHSFLKNLYAEVTHFNLNFVKLYMPGPKDDTQYGHFTQMMWATTWKIGCGWTLFSDEKLYKSYTACNYGPGGNLIEGNMYEEGPTCSACPKNTCCGDECQKHNTTAKYAGLCKVIHDFASPEGSGPHNGEKYPFYCDFNNQPDCKVKFHGKPWMVIRTPGGNWLSNVLEAGENTALDFIRPFKIRGNLCFELVSRNGPNVDGEPLSGKGSSTFSSELFTSVFQLKTKDIKNRQEFVVNNYNLKLPEGKTFKIQYSFNFSVPPESSTQFIEIRKLSAREC